MAASYMMFHTWKNPPATLPALLMTGWRRRPITASAAHQKKLTVWALDFSCSRSGMVRVGGETEPWQERLAGVGHLYPPHTPYWESADSGRAMRTGGYVVFSGGDELGLRRLVQPGTCYVRIEDPGKQLARPLQAIAQAGYSRGDLGYWEALSAFFILVDILQGLQHVQAEKYLLPRAEGLPRQTGLPLRLRKFMIENLQEKLTLEDMADALHVSPSTLSHHYRKETGISPIQALIELRLNKAQALMQTSLTLEEIARQTGFYDAFHLSKAYKRHRGTSPRTPTGPAESP